MIENDNLHNFNYREPTEFANRSMEQDSGCHNLALIGDLKQWDNLETQNTITIYPNPFDSSESVILYETAPPQTADNLAYELLSRSDQFAKADPDCNEDLDLIGIKSMKITDPIEPLATLLVSHNPKTGKPVISLHTVAELSLETALSTLMIDFETRVNRFRDTQRLN